MAWLVPKMPPFASALLLVFLLSLRCPRCLGQQCFDNFEKGEKDFVLDTDDSVKAGATFIASPSISSPDDCVHECCRVPNCNVALIEKHEAGGSSCFLFDCLYKQEYVCKFMRKVGFNTYILKSVYEANLKGSSTTHPDKPPIAKTGQDRVVQSQEELMLEGNESWDDHGIESYHWKLVSGNPSIVIDKTNLPDQVKVSNLTPGVYKFELTVVDSIGQSNSAVVKIIVLTLEQSQNHCLVPKKVGMCRGSFPRWHYNAATNGCEPFTFGGCKGNNNNYLTQAECTKACQGMSATSPSGRMGIVLVPTEICGSPCTADQFTCANGCCLDKGGECDMTTQCSDGSDERSCNNLDKQFKVLLQIPVNEQKVRCTDPPRTGPCRASFTHWYYDPLSRKCLRFNYGGCEGNDNRFEVEDACMNTCRTVTSEDVFARGAFEYQESQHSQSGTIAIAVLLGVAILIMLAILGYCFLKGRKDQSRPQRVAANGGHTFPVEDTERLVYNSTTKPI
ncbi:kunitz-type protease inhibitor 1a [Scleropages formosus]|uniref:Serine peptidase inhibitor, Kunitz type 1 a n=2 Tax=Scleropages formosus TaxID=113540 RepID=A0A8C9WHX6_SCLFO|nr:kunitz-type protease inhibitor 1 [Scleropages formosus]XP_018583245.1 kunitz-type protease inhibitor 1 [Scleropages formosus]